MRSHKRRNEKIGDSCSGASSKSIVVNIVAADDGAVVSVLVEPKAIELGKGQGFHFEEGVSFISLKNSFHLFQNKNKKYK